TSTGGVAKALHLSGDCRHGTFHDRSQRRIAMGILSWIVLGAIAGWLGSMLVNRTGEGLLRDIVLGIVGGVVGGWIFATLGSEGVTGSHLWGVVVAGVGAGIVLMLYHAVFGRTATR